MVPFAMAVLAGLGKFKESMNSHHLLMVFFGVLADGKMDDSSSGFDRLILKEDF